MTVFILSSISRRNVSGTTTMFRVSIRAKRRPAAGAAALAVTKLNLLALLPVHSRLISTAV